MVFNKYLIAGLSALLLVTACKEDASEAAKNMPAVPAIKIKSDNVPLSFEFPARARGYKETEVRARVNGILLKRNYTEGAVVAEGDVLFQIDPEPYQVELKQAKGKLAEAEAQLKAAETQWVRIEKLFKERIVSEKSRDDARANLDSLRANVEAATAAVNTAELNLKYTTVTAPIGGHTSLESQSEGSLISSTNNSLLTTITQLDPIYVMFSVSDSDVFNMRNMVSKKLINGDSKGSVVAKIKFHDNSIYDHSGEINFVNPTIDEATGTVTLRAVFPNPDKLIMPQQFVRIVIEGITRSNAITIPQEVVMQGSKGPFVYIQGDNGEVGVANITLGNTTQNGAWIVSEGLKDGDVIFTAGTMQIREGMKLTPKFADAPQTSQQ